MATSPLSLARQLLGILHTDLPRLMRIDDYVQGNHDDPYMPATADDEYRLLAKRSISNWIPLLVRTPTQALYVDSFRDGNGENVLKQDSPGWKHWQRSRLDARQIPVHRGAITFGHSFALTERTSKGVVTKGLSALRTAAVYEDPANDITPIAMLHVTQMPDQFGGPGQARMWDSTFEYAVTFKSLMDPKSVRVTRLKRHGADECPGTRFAAYVDLEGRTTGVVEPMIPIQNRINQTVFDLLMAQTYGSFKVRTISGMQRPVRRDADGVPVLDDDGNEIPLPINISAKRLLWADDADTKFGTLDETPLNGYIDAIDMAIRHLAAISQTPPHHLLGQIANLSAEALQAAETALARMIAELEKTFGESWERVLRLAAAMDEGYEVSDDAEVIWRDMGSRSLAAVADALGKLVELGIPRRGLWARVPNVTKQELEHWEELRQEDDLDREMVEQLRRAATPQTRPVAA